MLLLILACTAPDSSVDDSSVDSVDSQDSDSAAPRTGYAFIGRGGESSVATEGQVFRHLLIVDMKNYLGALTGRIDGGWFPEAGEVSSDLNFYLDFDSDTSSGVPHSFVSDPAALQSTYGEVATGKNLTGKIAGNDAKGQYRDWSTGFVGWPQEGVTTPESLVRLWISEVDAASVAWSNGQIPKDPSGAPVPAVFVDAQGRDRQQLLQKFLLGAVAFSQGADDYLDDDLDGAGLLSDHSALEEGEPYTALEHAWDEGFGYFGASADYCGGDEATASPGYADTVTPDGAIDLVTEVCWGHSTNAAKRDLGAVAPTDLSGQAWDAFLAGRTLLAETEAPLTATQLAELQAQRDLALQAWEAAIAASVVHYINGVLVEMGEMDTAEYSFADHSKEWSEMKGFALSFQFNRRSPLSEEQFAELHTLLGTAPVLADASPEARTAYKEALLSARALLGEAYGFDAANLGDDEGKNGW